MGNIAPPLEKPFFSFDGGESIQMKSIQGDNPEEARQAQRMDQAMQDDSRLGLAKNQQYTQTTDTAKIQVAQVGNIDMQKVEQFPPEVYRLPEYPPQEAVPACACYDSTKLSWGGAFWDLGGISPGMTGFQTYMWAELSPAQISGSIPPCVKIYSCWLEDAIYNYDSIVWTGAYPACNMEIKISAKWGTAYSNKWYKFDGVDKWHLTSGPITNAVPPFNYPFIIFATDAFVHLVEDPPYYTGPAFVCGPNPWSDGDSEAGLASPLYLWCDGVRIAGIPWVH